MLKNYDLDYCFALSILHLLSILDLLSILYLYRK